MARKRKPANQAFDLSRRRHVRQRAEAVKPQGAPSTFERNREARRRLELAMYDRKLRRLALAHPVRKAAAKPLTSRERTDDLRRQLREDAEERRRRDVVEKQRRSVDPLERERLERPKCKARPSDNLSKGGGSRAFIPWCR